MQAQLTEGQDQQSESIDDKSEQQTHSSPKLNFQEFIQQKPVLVFLGSLFTVLICCIFSQCLVRISKNYNLSLQKYYSKKKYEKAKLIQRYLNTEDQSRTMEFESSLVDRNRGSSNDRQNENDSFIRGGAGQDYQSDSNSNYIMRGIKD
ncbi:UNKNOWN [Stylonychia lemnae]|uniref:Transmembrane protein n=1 Tax=Stylonychia lemnae TaxID=5949 RepID=A0A078A4A7_STYLE|nr:UNKNOWN [Stylonychia lemnae]|eukprot:CDW76734.1 UNKNOWN [Stylonychia lemnae]